MPAASKRTYNTHAVAEQRRQLQIQLYLRTVAPNPGKVCATQMEPEQQQNKPPNLGMPPVWPDGQATTDVRQLLQCAILLQEIVPALRIGKGAALQRRSPGEPQREIAPTPLSHELRVFALLEIPLQLSTWPAFCDRCKIRVSKLPVPACRIIAQRQVPHHGC